MDSTVHFHIYDPISDKDKVLENWEALLKKSEHYFFLSMGWISTWLASLPTTINIFCVVGTVDNEPILAFFVSTKNNVRHKLLFTKNIYINSTGREHYDELTIEYNSILLATAIHGKKIPAILAQTVDFLSSNFKWEELYIHGATEKTYRMFQQLTEDKGKRLLCKSERRVPSHYVDLKKIRSCNMDYYRLLSSNKRAQIRRSLKEYEKNSAIRVEQADTVEEAASMLAGLSRLHQQTWIRRGKPGSFANNYFTDFHTSLIKNIFTSGTVQLLKFSNNTKTIGYIYNFIYNNEVFFYQCGFNYSNNNKMRPGIVSHYLAIRHNAINNYDNYYFLAGTAQYKASLSTDTDYLTWMKIQKKRKKFFLEDVLKTIKLHGQGL
jgi:hypothetical protein